MNLPLILHLFKIGNEVEWRVVYKEARKHKWFRSLHGILKYLAGIHRGIYDEEDRALGFPIMNSIPNKLYPRRIPIALSRRQILTSFIEKRLVSSSLNVKDRMNIPFVPLKAKHSHEVNISSLIRFISLGPTFHEEEYISPPELDILNRVKI